MLVLPSLVVWSGALVLGQNTSHPGGELDSARRAGHDDPSIIGHARRGRARGGPDAAVVFTTPELGDQIPLPIARSFAPGNTGDTLASQAGGNPFVLRFIGGDFTPDPSERLDPRLVAQALALPQDGRPQAVVYAFAMLEKRVSAARVAALEALGVRVLGIHPHYALRVAVPVARLDQVAALDFVHWLGVARPEQKVHPLVRGARDRAPEDQLTELHIAVFESDVGADSRTELAARAEHFDAGRIAAASAAATQSATEVIPHGWQQTALEARGLEVLEYYASINVFRVRAPMACIDELAALDFVQFVEPVYERGPAHGESTPMVSSDAVRSAHTGGLNHATVLGILDSGTYLPHDDLDHAFAVGWEFGGSGGAYSDPCGHGTHVSGTILGDGSVEAQARGNAPRVGWGTNGRYFIAKVSNTCANWQFNYSSVLNALHSSYDDGLGHVTPAPHAINNSWGSSPYNAAGNFMGAFVGSETDCRAIDEEVFQQHQMHIFAAGNDGQPNGGGTVWLQAVAKNALTVGSVDKTWSVGDDLPGELSSFSSIGPTADLRAKPNLVAPGQAIRSADSSSQTGYTMKSGTSMATPHVTGIVGQLLDEYDFLRYSPHRVASLLMATAIPKDFQNLTVALETHRMQYGAGKVDSELANFGSPQFDWTNWGFWLPANTAAATDFYVAPGCTRLTICMVYNEGAASAGASAALVNDLDLYVDQPPIDPNPATGEYSAHISSHDNVELRTIDNPTSGVWRWKIWPESAPQGVHCSVSVAMHFGDLTPDAQVTISAPKQFVKPFEEIEVSVHTSSPSSVASNVVLEPDYSTEFGYATNIESVLADGGLQPVAALWNSPVLLGDIVAGRTRDANFRLAWWNEGLNSMYASVRGENVATVTQSMQFTVDGTPPDDLADMQGVLITPGVWSNRPLGIVFWSPATDNLSGVGAYAVALSSGAPTDPGTTPGWTSNLFGWVPSTTSPGAGDWVSVRAIDRCGNVGNVASVGPFLFDYVDPAAIGGLTSTTHVLGSTTCASDVTMTWNDAFDAHSGIAGYATLWDTNPSSDPGTTIVESTASSTTSLLSPAAVTYYFHVRAIDSAGNAGPVADWGPITIDASSGGAFTSFCTQNVTSGGCVPWMYATGCASLSGTDDLHVHATGVDGHFTARVFISRNPVVASTGGAVGHISTSPLGLSLCIGGGAAGPLAFAWGTPGLCDGGVDTHLSHAMLASLGFQAGDTVYAQYVLRDPGAPHGVGQSDALQFTLQP